MHALVFFFFFSLGSGTNNNIIVSKDGSSGNYTTVGEAIANAPDLNPELYTIHVLAGIYEEYILIPPHKINIKLLGDGPNHTIILAHQNGSTIGMHAFILTYNPLWQKHDKI